MVADPSEDTQMLREVEEQALKPARKRAALATFPRFDAAPAWRDMIPPGGTECGSSRHDVGSHGISSWRPSARSRKPVEPYEKLPTIRACRTANVAHADVADFLDSTAEILIRPETREYPLAEANAALHESRNRRIRRARVFET
jgi:hypothetical protein